MDNTEGQLTDFRFISDELSKLLDDEQGLLLSLIEKHSHGESIDIEEDIAKTVVAKLGEIKEDPERQIIKTHLALESLVHIIPHLIAENNKRLLRIIPHISP